MPSTFSTALLLLSILLVPSTALPQPMTISDSTKQPPTQLCGADASIVLSDTPWIIYNMFYNAKSSVGTQCTSYSHVSMSSSGAQTISWSSETHIKNVPATSNVPKGYAFIGLTKSLSTRLTSITSIPASYTWTLTNTTAYKGNICLDFMTAPTAGDSTSSSAQELMLWLTSTGGQLPIGWPKPTHTIPSLYGRSWKLYQGVNEDTGITVSSLLPDKGFEGEWEGDVKEWLAALVGVGVLKKDTFVNVGNAGTEYFWGDAVVNATVGLEIVL
ncbi:concanavalin A-like lectin/glucanase [Bimuria novae-zelandiae CBS 107.79]|uniref:Concanavalin A-like lectin/glucanase n=1 Tax=Bimuria novae-zelandiae CBS 107.79 TaxID=1447943 RepID=A0A6A5VTI8_9PLEO|nr:concanavalin A-like lectin/glucanase [Bimuria novae-zelandiae CBS 107.79]